MSIRNRKKEYRTVKASELIPNERNWRRHPEYQRNALRDLLETVGDIDVLKVVDTPEGLLLVDGHLRSEIVGDDEVDVVVLDLDEEEMLRVLTTYDPVGAMATRDQDKFLASLAELPPSTDAIEALNEAVANNNYVSLVPPLTPELGPELDETLGDGVSLCICQACGNEHAQIS